jgi:hypothetical protein
MVPTYLGTLLNPHQTHYIKTVIYHTDLNGPQIQNATSPLHIFKPSD